MKGKVCIITTVHSAKDTRIFHKEAKSLAKGGYQVTIIAPHEAEEQVGEIKIIPLPSQPSHFARLFKLSLLAFWYALNCEADVYHFHDPELIPVGFLLKIFNSKVIYDIHENYNESIRNKSYLSSLTKHIIASLYNLFEKVAHFILDKFIIVSRYHEKLYSDATLIYNYPKNAQNQIKSKKLNISLPNKPKLIYTGNVSEDRGALNHANLVNLDNDVHLYMIGKCQLELAAKIRQVAGKNKDRVHIIGEGNYVPHQKIVSYYKSGRWLAGLALLPSGTVYEDYRLTKFFEYMQNGIPILASNFSLWEDLISSEDCGLTVDVNHMEQIEQALAWLQRHKEEAKEMGINGRKAVKDRYNWKKEEEKLLDLYEGLI